MERNAVLKVCLGLLLAVGLPIGGALAYGSWLTQHNQALKDQRDAAHALAYTIPLGSSKRFRPIQDQVIALSPVITLTIGLSDTLRIHNADTAPGRVGPFKIDGGMTYRQQFQLPGRFPFVCTINPANSVTVVVLPKK